MKVESNYRKRLRIALIEKGITLFDFYSKYIAKHGYSYSIFANCLYGNQTMKLEIENEIERFLGVNNAKDSN